MPTCEKIREEFSALLDGELDAETREAVEAHLHECSECLLELSRYKKVSEMYNRMERVPAPPDFEARVADAIWPKIVPLPERKKFHLRWMPAFAAAAVLLIIAGTFVVLPTVYAPGTLKISKLKEAPAAETVPQPEPPEAAPEQKLFSGEKNVTGQTEDEAAPSNAFFARVDTTGKMETQAAPALAPTPAPIPAPPMLRQATPLHEIIAPKLEPMPEMAKEEPKPEPKPELKPEPKPEPKLKLESEPEQKVLAKAAVPEKDQGVEPSAPEEAVGGAAPDLISMTMDATEMEEESKPVEAMPSVASAPAAASAPPTPPAPAASAPVEEGRGRRSAARGTFGAGYGGPSVMKEQKVSHAPTQTNERALNGKTFDYLEDTWFERGYSGQNKVSVDRGSSQYQDLLKKYPAIAQWSDLGSRVVLKLDDTWYLIVAGTKQP